MALDPYTILGVTRDAPLEQLRAAYEREIAGSHRLGGLSHAQEVSAAWDVLSDPARRRALDTFGVTLIRERVPPSQRYLATPPPAWRATSRPLLDAASAPAAPRACPPPRSRLRVLLTLLALLGLLVGGATTLRAVRAGPGPQTTVRPADVVPTIRVSG